MERSIPLGAPRRKSLGSRVWPVLVLLLVLLLLLAWFRVGAPPRVTIEPGMPAIGPATPVRVVIEEPRRGLGALEIELTQDGEVFPLEAEEFHPRPFWAFWGPRTPSHTAHLEIGSRSLPKLREGEAVLAVKAHRAPTWLRHPSPEVVTRTFAVRLRPPRLEVEAAPASVSTGGSGLVVYRVGPEAASDGVRVGSWHFEGYPLGEESKGMRLALFGVPFDLTESLQIRLEASDELGNRVEVPFLPHLKVVPFAQDQIRLDKAFLERVVPPIQAETPDLKPSGDTLKDYLEINRNLRAANAEALRRLAANSAHGFLWQGRFLQLPGSQVMSSFADRRTYLFEGREVDQQDHLGFDLASTRQAPVPAANGGTVVLARYFGIYGRTVVVDHGYGLMTLYAHLSSISVEEGQRVAKGDILGRTGATGLAGGDHLHFSTLIHGLPVNPLEWWDARWIERQILDKVNGS
ncbi:MAG: M23 family metallopeptidase [Acidobacteria bacterium]|nr:M23 family metallopeptidase [Acidobacteriota bacterium]